MTIPLNQTHTVLIIKCQIHNVKVKKLIQNLYEKEKKIVHNLKLYLSVKQKK